nr:hypothetical protein Iba_chr02aCG5510 [Ipomoea batatas]
MNLGFCWARYWMLLLENSTHSSELFPSYLKRERRGKVDLLCGQNLNFQCRQYLIYKFLWSIPRKSVIANI